MRPLLIGFGYKARHGKDSVVAAILDQRGKEMDIRRYSVGDLVREEVAGKEEELCKKFELPYEPDNKHRALLQFYGTDYRRKQFGKHYWVRKLADKIIADQPDVVLISDLRFKNECEWIKSHGGVTVRVERTGFRDGKSNVSHKSEIELDDYAFDALIEAKSGEVDLLRQQAVSMFDHSINWAHSLEIPRKRKGLTI